MPSPANLGALVTLRRAVNPSDTEVLGFLHVRNESARIRNVLDHHRKLGVKEFFVVDNMSEDDTRDYLQDQEDVNLFLSRQSFSQSHFGMAVMNELLDAHGAGRWCLTVDADEHFVYPHCENKSINAFTRYLERKNYDSVFTIMLDMYSNVSIARTEHAAGRPLQELCNYFDRGPYSAVKSGTFPFVELRGGPRMRVFWSKEDAFHPPTVSKVPLVRWRKGFRYVSAAHYMRPAPSRLADVSGALLHFKYLSDFHERAQREAARKEHFSGAREYQKYVERLARDPDLTLYYDNSVSYRKSIDLVQLGLCRNSSEWGLFI